MSDDDADPTRSPDVSRGANDGPPESEADVDNDGEDPFAALDDHDDDPVEPVEDVFDALGSDGADDRFDRDGDDAEAPFTTSDDAEAPFTTSDDDEDPFATPDDDGDPFATPDDDGDPFAALEDDGDVADAFEHMEVDELSDDDVWDALGEEEGLGDVAAGAEPDGIDHVVDKRKYCQRCPHFSEPPETACMHEKGEILEVLEGGEFRVRNCPMIAEEGPRFDRS